MGGKLVGRAVTAATASPGRPGRLGLLRDDSTNNVFLVDTGSVYSIIPHQSSQPPHGPPITTADGQPVKCWGVVQRTLQVGRRIFKWDFLQAAISFSIVGADFLDHFGLSVDLKNMRLTTETGDRVSLSAPPVGSVFASIGLKIPASPTPLVHAGSSDGPLQHRLNICSTTSTVRRPADSTHSRPDTAYQELLQEFPEVVNPSKRMPKVKHQVEHHIEMVGRPVSAKYRRLDAAKLKAAREEFLEMERQGIVRRSDSSWASPLHMVRKADGSWRPCGDFRRLNVQTQPDRYTCPNIGDLTARLAGCKVFSKLDLRKGYHQVPVRKADIKKTAIITPFGLFEFLRMPFGLRNAGQTFQRMMDNVLAGLDYTFVYLDDVLVASASHEEHAVHLREVLSRLSKHGLVLNAEKCQLGVPELDYLGHHVAASGIKPIVDRVAAIKDFPLPSDVGHLQTYLGMVNFYRRFLPAAARVLRPLTDSLQGGGRGAIMWTAEMKKAFEDSKLALYNACELAHPDPRAEISLVVDASDTHVGAVLQQTARGQLTRPLAFFSAKLDKAQRKYSAFDRELLAVYLGIRHFRWLLEGRVFYVVTDHKPLTFAMLKMADAWSARQQRHLSFISEFSTDIRHIAGRENVVADALSWPSAAVTPGQVAVVTPSTSGRLDFRVLAREQSVCVETQQLMENTCLQTAEVVVDGVPLWCDVSTGLIRPLVPESQRKAVFNAIHELAHPGTRATRRLVTSRFVWPRCSSDVATWCKQCPGCARGKITIQEKTAPALIPVPEKRFSHVHVDLVGPLPPSKEGYTHVLTVIDRSTRWPEVFPVRDLTAQECADTFTAGWVARYGVPHTVTSDRGTQFSSAIWDCMCRTLGIKHVSTTAYHPQSNGMIERFHRQLKEALRARQCGTAWLEHLPWVLLGLRAAPKETSGVSSAEAVFGTPLVLPSQAQPPPVLTVTEPEPVLPEAIPARQRSYAEAARARPSLLTKATHVYVKRGPQCGTLEPRYSGPYQVIEKLGKTCKLQVGPRMEVVSADRLKSCEGVPVEVAVPPRRGRPPQERWRRSNSSSTDGSDLGGALWRTSWNS